MTSDDEAKLQKGLLHSRLSCLSGDAAVGEVLACNKEVRNAIDRYAVAVKKDGMIIGHLPRKVLDVCSLSGSLGCRDLRRVIL